MTEGAETTRATRLAVVVSGRGSNLQAILDAVASGALRAEVCVVASNQPDAPALDRARRAGVPTVVVDHREVRPRAAFDAALADALEAHRPDYVVLAGFMRVLGAPFVERFAGRLVNIHPSLLPAFPGLDTHRRALEAGVAEHGATVHFVTAELDGGPSIARARVPVHPDDDPDRLAARVLAREHVLLPTVLAWLVAGKVRLEHGRVTVDSHPAPLDI
ncbi:MAG: phosphoribosylglycinamide formyltransferase [Ectothiorhodospiraceae bacterium]|nr:phosphoribosylglycinamide formyltransferase [Ectothiorhodospiraceae bacterium]